MDIFGNFSKLPGDRDKRKVHKKNELDFSYAETVADPISKVEGKSQIKQVLAIKAVLVLLFCMLIFKFFMFQIINGANYQLVAEKNHIQPRVVDAIRGLIMDKSGTWLARNEPSFALAVYPSSLPKKKSDREEIYKKIADLSGVSIDEIRSSVEKVGSSSLSEVDIKENIPHDDALLLEEKVVGIPGVFIANKSIREYQVGNGLAHILGYTGLISDDELKKNPKGTYYQSDRYGKSGLENQYESYLKGTHGIEQIEVDSKGNIIKVLADQNNKEPVPGNSLTLNLDLPLQQNVTAALKAGIDSATQLTGAPVTAGSAIVMDVNTGGILSMVSLPDYDDNLFSPKISNSNYQLLRDDKNSPLLNRSIAGLYPPGSISKIVLASAGLQEGTITASTAFNTPAAIKIGDYTFPDWKDHSYESTNVERALAESNNVFFYSVGGGFDKIKGLGIDKIKQYWQLFGLGEKTGIDLPGEASGLLPDSAWKQKVKNEPWYIGDTYHVSIGQGDMLVTPIQMLRATAAIANGGKLLQPQIVNKVVDSSGKVVTQFGPNVIRENFISPQNIKTVQEGMRLAVTDGSARSLNDLPVAVAGKTGTAQFLNNEKTHAWFTCYAPYDNPQIAVIVLVDGGGGGHEIAAPVAKEILNYYFSK